MKSSTDCIVVNNPNGPSNLFKETVPFAEWVEPAKDISSIENEIASLKVKDLNLPNFYMRTTEGSFTKTAYLLNTSGQGIDLLGSCLFPKIEISTCIGKNNVSHGVSGTQNIKYDPNNVFRHLIPANIPFHIIHFAVHPDYFLQYLPEEEKWADSLKNKIARGESLMGSRYASITLPQQRILQNILECPLTGKMASFMMEASIVQLFLLQLHELFQSNSYLLPNREKKDMEMALGIREYLSGKFLDEHSLESLSREFGTNTNKLMTVFKKTFGKSLFEYIYELRMDFAHKMLQTQEHTVIEISRLMGYKNANHFSTAFKRRFGVSPSQVI